MSLSIEALATGYGKIQVLSDITLSQIPLGSVVGVLGRNGSGKSTLLRALAGLLPHEGKIALNGDTLSQKPSRFGINSAISYLPQTLPQGTSLIAYESIYSAFRAYRSDLSRTEIEARIEAVFDRLGIRHLALKRMNELSGGQRQMVGLAQVLARQPKLLLLDEPTSALDLHWQLGVLEAVCEMARDHQTIALISIHDINLALRFCQKLIVLADGSLLSQGDVQDTLTPEVLHRAYKVQARIERCSQGRPIVLCDQAFTYLSKESSLP